jgi:hypothetical protein
MIVIELMVWILKFVFMSISHFITFPFLLFSAASFEQKLQGFKELLLSLGILLGVYLVLIGKIWLGIGLILGLMIFAALVIKDDGTL